MARAPEAINVPKDDDERGKAAGYMEGLAALRKEWKSSRPRR